MDVRSYLDATYLKTPAQAGISVEDNNKFVHQFVNECIENTFKLVMIRPDVVAQTRKQIDDAQSEVLIGTVIGFPEGTHSIQEKLKEAAQAIEDGADELDFVCNYQAFKSGNTSLVKEEIVTCTRFALSHHKTVKWIIEIAALTNDEIVRISALIKNAVIDQFKESDYPRVFVKSSTGFFVTEGGKPNGATREGIILMLENASPLPIKAAGGVRNYEEAIEMIKLGVMRIGTSAAKAIVDGEHSESEY